MKAVNWDAVNTASDKKYPVAGGYIATITEVIDMEDKEYLIIKWDYAEGFLAGYNASVFKKVGFWPCSFVQSYKTKALPFFKRFKNALEASNPRYAFDEQDLQGMVGLNIGVLLGEEEYKKNNGGTGKRVYFDKVVSVAEIETRDFKIPPFKPLGGASTMPDFPAAPAFAEIDDEDEDTLPF